MTGATAIVPIRSWQSGKSRLSDDPRLRQALARAMSLDTLEAVRAAGSIGRVLVVTAAQHVEDECVALGVAVLRDEESEASDLNDAIRGGLAWAARHAPDERVVVVPADLPALDAASVDAVLDLAGSHAIAHVADLEGSGTTFSVAAAPRRLTPAYGPGSSGAHAAGGSVLLAAAPARARLDVDTLADLEQAARLGLGPRTARVRDELDRPASPDLVDLPRR